MSMRGVSKTFLNICFRVSLESIGGLDLPNAVLEPKIAPTPKVVIAFSVVLLEIEFLFFIIIRGCSYLESSVDKNDYLTIMDLKFTVKQNGSIGAS